MSVFVKLSQEEMSTLINALSIAYDFSDTSVRENIRELYSDVLGSAGIGTHEPTNKAIRDFRGEGWNNAAMEISALPCWFKDKDNHGFDFGDDENGYASETGARKYIMEILQNSPYTDSYVDPRVDRPKRGRIRKSVLQRRIDAGLADPISDEEKALAEKILKQRKKND